jgi:hypothetical protein
MIPVRFKSTRSGIALTAVHAAEPYELRLTGDDRLVQREAQDLSPREQQLLPEPRRGLIFLHDDSDENLTIRLQKRKSRYSAEIDVSFSVVGKSVTEAYVFRIEPKSARLETVEVEFLKRPGVPVRWSPFTAVDETSRHPDTRQAANGQAAGRVSRLERWELRLAPSRSEPLEIRATRTYPLEDVTAVGLARLPDATEQEGRLTVALSCEEPVRIENRALTPVLSGLSPIVAGDVARSSYQYDPKRSLITGTPPLVLRRVPSSSGLSKACVWQIRLESRLEPNGTGKHSASYRVESSGTSVFYLSLPSSIGVQQIEPTQRARRVGRLSGAQRLLSLHDENVFQQPQLLPGQ